MPDRSGGRSGSIYTDSQSQRPVLAPRPVASRCFLCNSPAHLASACPQKSSGGGFTPKPTLRPQANFCKTKQKADPVSYQPKQAIDGARVTHDISLGSGTRTPVIMQVCILKIAVSTIQLILLLLNVIQQLITCS